MRSKLAIALMAPLVFLGGYGGSKPTEAKFEGPVVPWVSSRPSELAERTPVTTPCRAADLTVHGQVDFAAYGNGGGIAVIALQHKGKQECRLEGSPRVQLVKHGGPRPAQEHHLRPPPHLPDHASALSRP